MKVQLKDIKANPFRDIGRYPINEKKIETLRRSIQKTGFWDNCVARKVNGHVELAYGHHRLVALREEFPPDHEVNMIPRDLDDADMIRVMANENQEEWGHNASVTMETIRAVVNAIADGKITMPRANPGKVRRIRIAPSFCIEDPQRKSFPPTAYTSKDIQEFLGWSETNVNSALKMLETVELGLAEDETFAGIPLTTAYEVASRGVKAATKLKNTPLAKKIIKDVTDKSRAGIGAKALRDEADKMIAESKDAPPPDVSKFTQKLTSQLYAQFKPDNKLCAQLSSLLDHVDQLDDQDHESIVVSLEKLASEAASWAKQFRGARTTINIEVEL
ncbi:MAG: ParB/RepB/Spo0J family partition protein [Gammaproteobacteria bacterium]|nr:ParB/RepB/Spo0J family partition protein [Gammaproteobacteria bacterium]